MLTPSAVDVDDSTSKDVTENENVDEDGDNTAEADVDVNFVTGAVAFSFDTGGVDGAEGGSDADDTDNSPAVVMLKKSRINGVWPTEFSISRVCFTEASRISDWKKRRWNCVSACWVD